MPGVKNQHYVPRFYLKSFTDEAGCLSAIRRDAGGLKPVVLSDSPELKDNQYYAWIQDLVSSHRTNSELAEELRCGFVAGTGDLSLV